MESVYYAFILTLLSYRPAALDALRIGVLWRFDTAATGTVLRSTVH